MKTKIRVDVTTMGRRWRPQAISLQTGMPVKDARILRRDRHIEADEIVAQKLVALGLATYSDAEDVPMLEPKTMKMKDDDNTVEEEID